MRKSQLRKRAQVQEISHSIISPLVVRRSCLDLQEIDEYAADLKTAEHSTCYS